MISFRSFPVIMNKAIKLQLVFLKEECSTAVAISCRKCGIIKIIFHHRQMRKMQSTTSRVLDFSQVVLSQKEKETKRKALGGAREAWDRASKCERSEAREACTTCFACRKSNRMTLLWREASGCFHELVFQRIRRLTKMNYFLRFVSSCDDLTHLSLPLKLNFS